MSPYFVCSVRRIRPVKKSPCVCEAPKKVSRTRSLCAAFWSTRPTAAIASGFPSSLRSGSAAGSPPGSDARSNSSPSIAIFGSACRSGGTEGCVGCFVRSGSGCGVGTRPSASSQVSGGTPFASSTWKTIGGIARGAGAAPSTDRPSRDTSASRSKKERRTAIDDSILRAGTRVRPGRFPSHQSFRGARARNSSRVLSFGNGTSGTATPRKAQSGSQPWSTEYTSRRSGGTSRSTAASCSFTRAIA